MWRHRKPEEHDFINVPEKDVLRSNDEEPKGAIKEVASEHQEQDIQENNDDEPEDVIEEVALEHQDYEPEDVIEEVALEHQEEDVPESNEDEPEEVTMAIAPNYQGYRYFLSFCFPISRKGTQQQLRAKAKLGARLSRPCPSLSLEISLVHRAQLKKFSWWELHAATDNFNKNNILGRGAFGSVYKGKLVDGSLVAVKRQKERTPAGDLQFQTEVTMISMEMHRNLLRLYGLCMTPTERLLVYPYMVNGSVASWLYDREPWEPPLDWDTRRRIAVGSARGLSCLHDHCDPKIIHRDVKAANILLDEDFEAIVSDFGCAKLMGCNDAHETTVCGTTGHIAPEYRSTGSCSEKADVFSYGTMLLELITGKKAYDPARSANYVMLHDWVTRLLREKKVDDKFEMLADPNLRLNYSKTEVESLVQVALLCTEASPSARPPMSEVLKLLEGDGLVERWEEWLMAGMDQQFVGSTSNHPDEQFVGSTSNHPDEQFVPYTKIRSVELSGPR